MKNFSEFTDILKEHSAEFEKDAFDVIEKATVDGVLNRDMLIGFLPALNLKTCVKVLELYHEWISEQ